MLDYLHWIEELIVADGGDASGIVCAIVWIGLGASASDVADLVGPAHFAELETIL